MTKLYLSLFFYLWTLSGMKTSSTLPPVHYQPLSSCCFSQSSFRLHHCPCHQELRAWGSSLTHLINSQVSRFYFVMSWLCPLHFISAAPPSPSFSIHPDYVTVPLKTSSCFLSARHQLHLPLMLCCGCLPTFLSPFPSFFLFSPTSFFLLCTMAGIYFKIVSQIQTVY